MAGQFITIEGGEGVGKSTQITALAEFLKQRGIEVILTREPGGTEGAEAIRKLLLSGKDDKWSVRAEALLFAAARADHLEKKIVPALSSGKWVISDRFLDSSIAYQSGQDNLTEADIRKLHDIGSRGILPNRTLVLELSSSEGTKRADDRDGGTSDRIGARDANYHENVRKAFRQIADEEPNRVKVIDACGTPEQVTSRLVAALSDMLE